MAKKTTAKAAKKPARAAKAAPKAKRATKSAATKKAAPKARTSTSAAAAGKYQQSGAPWWKQFLPKK